MPGKTSNNPSFKNVQLIAPNNQLYTQYLNQFKPDNSVVRSKSVTAKSETMSYVLEIVVREWVKSSGFYSDERIIYYVTDHKKKNKKIFKEVDYILKNGTDYTIGELKVTAKGMLLKASQQLTYSKELLSSLTTSIDMQLIWIDLNYKNSNEPLDKFTPDFLDSKFRTIEVNNQKFKHLHLSADDIFKWGVEQKIIQTPELIQVAMIEADLLHQQRQIKTELKKINKLFDASDSEHEQQNLIRQIEQFEHDLTIISVKVDLSQKGWVHLTGKTEYFLKELIDELGKTIFVADLIVEPGSEEIDTTDLSLDFHTDHHKANLIAWHCIKQTEKGGETMLIDAEKIYHRLSDKDKKELESIEFWGPKIFLNDSESNPLVNNTGLRKFYYSFLLVKKEQKENSALLEFQRYIKESEPISLLLKPNDILLINNHRILHGRTEIEGSKDCYLKRFWISY